MRLSNMGRGIVAGGSGAMVLAMAGLIINAESPERSFAAAGSLERTVTALDEQGLNVAALSAADVYGLEWIAGAFVCPGETEESIAQQYQVDTAELNLDGEPVPEDTNYLMLLNAEESVAFDEIDRADIDFCAQPLPGLFDTRGLMPMFKADDGQWMLLQ